LAGARPSLRAADGLRGLMDRNLRIERLEDATLPVHVVATDVLSGVEVLLSSGDARDAVLASASIPAVLPPVTIDDRALFDGGIANNPPISQAVKLGADRIVVLPAGVACALPTAPRSAVGTAIHALTLLIEQRLVRDVAAYHDQIELIVLPPVTIDDRALFDGGIANNTPISQAVKLGADRIVVLPAGVACALPTAPRSAVGTAIHALTLLIEQRLVLDVAAYHDQVELIVLPPLCPLSVSSADFRHAEVLIDRAQDSSGRWLDSGNQHLPHPERFLALHDHPTRAVITHDCDGADAA
jgi:predicted acylesterase/phospholipase RssA